MRIIEKAKGYYWLKLSSEKVTILFTDIDLQDYKRIKIIYLYNDDTCSCFLFNEQADEFYKLWKELNND